MRLAFAVVVMLALPSVTRAQVSAGDQWLKEPVDDQTFSGFLDFFQYDANVPFDAKVAAVTARDGIRREPFTFQSTPGMRVSAVYYHASSPGAVGRPTVIFLHGGGAAGKNGLETYALQLVRGGFNVLTFDMLYFGERKTDLLTTFTEQEKHQHLYNQPAAYLAWVAQNVKDAGRAYDYLVQHRRANPRRIALVGFSRGGQQALIIGGADKRFVAIVAFYSGHFDRFEIGHRAAACPANYIGRIAPRPLYLVNGEFDSDYVKDVSVLPLHKLASKPTTIWVQTGHQGPAPDAFADMMTWLRVQLK